MSNLFQEAFNYICNQLVTVAESPVTFPALCVATGALLVVGVRRIVKGR